MGQRGISVEEFELRSPTLEDVFIKFTGEHFEDEGPLAHDPYMSMRSR
jgi:hypothetical protein